MTRIEEPEERPSFLGSTPSESAAYRAAAMATARRYYERDKEHYAKADADGCLIPLPMDHIVLGELLSHIDCLTAQLAAKDAEVERLREAVTTLRSACEAVEHAGNVSWGIDDDAEEECDIDDDERFMQAIEEAGKVCRAALAATSRGEG